MFQTVRSVIMFTKAKEQAVYNWLYENASEEVADVVFNAISVNAKQDLYSVLVDDGYIEDLDEPEDEDEDI